MTRWRHLKQSIRDTFLRPFLVRLRLGAVVGKTFPRESGRLRTDRRERPRNRDGFLEPILKSRLE